VGGQCKDDRFVHKSLDVKAYLLEAKSVPSESWPLQNIVITNIIWCIAYKLEFGGGVVYCPITVQSYCTRVGNAGKRGGDERMVDSCTTASQ